MNALNPASSSFALDTSAFTAAGASHHTAPHFGTLVRASDVLRMEPPPELIPGFLNEQGFAVLYAKPAACKSFLAQHLALGLATGTEAWGHRVPRRGVVYLAGGEGIAGLRNRFEAWSAATGMPVSEDDPLFVRCPPATLTDPAATRALADSLAANLDRAGVSASLIVVDTLNRNFGSGDENAQGPMADFVRNLDGLRDRFGATILVVHHTPRGATNPRGSSVLDGAADTMMEAAKLDEDEDGEKLVRLTITKQKDGADDLVAVFRREVVALPPLPTRPKRSSLYLRFLRHEAAPVKRKEGGPEDGLTERQREVLGVLRAANGRPLTTRHILDALRLDEVPDRATRSVSEALKALAKRAALGVERVSDREWRVSVE
ncbi:MAG: AAA family ATPase [Acetobacteraceae bacterium]